MKELFSSNEDFHNSAFLNWRLSPNEDIQNFILLADGYMSSALHLIDLCLKNTSDPKADKLIFPILHNANHGVELYLKAIVWTINKVNKNDEQYKEIHELDKLYENTIETIEVNQDLEFLEHFKENSSCLSNYINELYSKLRGQAVPGNMFFSRYPLSRIDLKTKSYLKQFYTEKINNIEIDLENLKEILEEIYSFLDQRVSYLYFNKFKKDY